MPFGGRGPKPRGPAEDGPGKPAGIGWGCIPTPCTTPGIPTLLSAARGKLGPGSGMEVGIGQGASEEPICGQSMVGIEGNLCLSKISDEKMMLALLK